MSSAFFLGYGYWNNKMTSPFGETPAQSRICNKEPSSLAETTHLYNAASQGWNAQRAPRQAILFSGSLLACFASVFGPPLRDLTYSMNTGEFL